MNPWKTFCLILTIVLLGAPAWAAFMPLRTDMNGDLPQAVVLEHKADQIQLEYRLPGLDLLEGTLEGQRWDRVEIPGGASDLDQGAPEVPHFTRLLIIPARSGVRVEFEALETTTIPNIHLIPAQEYSPEEIAERSLPVQYDAAVYSRNALFPETRVSVGEPAVMRGLRVVTLRTNPVQYNPVTQELQVTTRYRVTVHFEGTDTRNAPTRQFPLSQAWANLMRSQALNYDEQGLDEQNMGSYLIVCQNNSTLLTNLQPLIEWKKRKGHSVAVSTFTSGASTTTIKNLIQTAYNTWPVPPEYVLLVGDTGGSYTLAGWSPSGIDHPYSQLDGSDILADVAVGRFPAENATETTVMVNKVLFYEKIPYIATTDWYHQSVLIAGSSTSGLSTIQTNRYIKTRMVEAEYTRIDTLWYTMSGSVPTVVTNAINNGVTYFNYRGYMGINGFNNYGIDLLANGRKLPFCTVITCATGGFDGDSNMEHFFSVGTATTPKGAVAAIGTATTGTHPQQNNTVDMGIYAGIFDEGLTQTGTALNRGKLELYIAFNEHDPGSVSNFSLWNALAGDPGLELFNGAIRLMACSVPDTIPLGQNSLSLTVMENGISPVAGATVCYFKDTAMQEVGLTDLNGQITLPITMADTGNVKVTVTKHNFFPLVDSVQVMQAAVAVAYFSHTVDDDNVGGSSGDNDGIVNPGEIVQLPTVFKNYGSSITATNVSVTASASDPYATLTNATQTFPNLAPGATGNSSGSFLLNVAANSPYGHVIPLNFSVSSSQGSWSGLLELNLATYELTITSAVPSGSDPVLSPGETANYIITLKNTGNKVATSLTATLLSLDANVTVNDNSASFGTVNLNQTVSCSGNPFNLTASGAAPPGHIAPLQVTFTANGATVIDTVTVTLGNLQQTDPTGPDEYGYYCFDDLDANYPQHPTYSWVELSPHAGGQGTNLNLYDPYEDADVSTNVTLPFTFRYYGQNVTQITVCSNGWISAIPNVSFTDFRNYPIPATSGPSGHICPFWDDLTTSAGAVYSYYDAANHRFIVEWYLTPCLGTSFQQLFEVILLDPAYYPSPTGDGDIIFQYNQIQESYGNGNDIPYSTVGIERPDQQDGIELVYWNTYMDPSVAHLQNNRAYRFTTNFSYLPQTSSVDITLTPVSPPIQIPATGGSFNYNVSVSNLGATPVSFAGWVMQQIPDGSWQGPMLGPVYLTVAPGATITRLRTQNVPSTAQPGLYTYRGYLGVYSFVKWDSSSFTYTKLTTGDGPIVNNWDNYGESFDQEPAQTAFSAGPIPTDYALWAAYPNPFNPTTTLRFDLPKDSKVRLEIIDLLGRQVASLVSGQVSAGSHQIVWEAQGAPSGIYLVRLQADSYQSWQKLILLK